jgi:putative phosphoribosyl transferase
MHWQEVCRMVARFRDRKSAGQQLAQQLLIYADRPNVMVLALPRGGVPVAAEIAAVLHCPLDLCCVRKLGVPGHSELAFGAIASGGIRVLNPSIIRDYHLSQPQQQRVERQERQELNRREQLYRGDCSYPDLRHQTIILTDDGLDTGSSMMAAITVVQQQAQAVVVAVPVAPPPICHYLEQQVAHLVCLLIPETLNAIGCWYDDFHQVTDAEVQMLLAQP